MASSFNIVKADGSFFVVHALEADGPGNVSIPRQVLNVIESGGAGVNYFQLGDDLTYRFAPGFQFNVIVLDPLSFPPTANEGVYTVVPGGSTFGAGITTIPVVETIPRGFFTINLVTVGSKTWRIAGNHAAEFSAGEKFTISHDTGSLSAGIISALAGGPGVGSFTILGNFTPTFTAGNSFTVSGPGPNNGTYSVSSSTFGGGNTTIVVNQTVPFTTGASGSLLITGIGNGLYTVVSATDVGPNTNIVVSEVIPATPAANGFLSTNSFPITGVTVGPGGTWVISGNLAARFPVGSGFTVSGNGVGDGNYSVTSATNVLATTQIVVSGSIPLLATAVGQVVVGNIPLGHIQYTVPLTATPSGEHTSLTLPGVGYPHWGRLFENNDVLMLQNFANTTPPPSPMSGQLWYDSGTSTLNLFASTVYTITAVLRTPDRWTITSPPLVDLTTVFLPGVTFTVYGNTGIDAANIATPGSFPQSLVFKVLSSTNAGVGTPTTITIDTTVTLPLSNAIPGTLVTPIATGDGRMYLMTDWHKLALLDDVFSLDWKASVRATTTAALPAFTYNNGAAGVGATITANANGALPAQDGVTLVAGNRLLVTTATFENGIYVVTQVGSGGSKFILTRTTDADTNTKVTSGLATVIEEGTLYQNTAWFLTTDNPITVGTTALVFAQFAPPIQPLNQIVYGTGIGITSESGFTWIPATNILKLGNVAETGTITNGDGGTIVFNTGVITLTGLNGDFIEIGASVNIQTANAVTPTAITVQAGNATAVGVGGEVDIKGGNTQTGTGGNVQISGGNGNAPGGAGGSTLMIAGNGFNATPGSALLQGGGGVGAGPVVGGSASVAGGTGSNGSGGPVNLIGGDGIGATGGAINITGGQGTTGGGGPIIATGGAATNGTGGPVTIAGGPAVLSGNGGSVTLIGGLPDNGDGGAIVVQGHDGVGIDRNGGNVTITGGASTGAGAPGNIAITAGSTVGAGSNGGDLTLTAGNAFNFNIGGQFRVFAGDGGSAGGNGGDSFINGGNAIAGSGAGGFAALFGGVGFGGGKGGYTNMIAGAGGATGDGGNIEIVAGDAGAGAPNGGGAISIIAGAATGGTNTGGNVSIAGGGAGCAQTLGRVIFGQGGSAVSQHNGEFGAAFDAQTVQYVERITTTNAAATEMFLDGDGGCSRRMTLTANSAWRFEIHLVGYETVGANVGWVAAYEIKGAIKNVAGTTAIVGVVSSNVTADDSTGTWVVLVDADDPNDALRIQVTGQAVTTIRWVAFIRTVEVTA